VNISAKCHAIDPYNFELYRFKVGAFFEIQCTCILVTQVLTVADKIENSEIVHSRDTLKHKK